jgi:hypothetical protein
MQKYSNEFLKRMKMFGLLQYSIDRMLVIISGDDEKTSLAEFKKDFSNPSHPVFTEYDKGFKNADFAVEIALFDKAKKGEKDAVEMLEDYRARRQYEVKVKELASLLARSPQTVHYAKACFDAALDCRLKVADTGLPDEMLKIKLQLISPDTKIDRLAITEVNLKKAFEEGLKMIDTFDIPETDRKRITGEFSRELGITENAEIIEDGEQ